MTRTRTCYFALFLALGVLLVACGDKEPAAPDAGGPATPVVSYAPPSATVVHGIPLEVDPETGFATTAFPPTLPNTAWHESTWTAEACLECHATGEDEAPIPKHTGFPDLVGRVACRACHVLAPDE